MIAIFLFFTKGKGFPNTLSIGQYKRCSVIVATGGNYIMVQMTRWGIRLRRLRTTNLITLANKLFLLKDLGSVVCVKIKKYPQNRLTQLWLRTCNELARQAGGVDLGITLNPTHLFKKLLKYDNTRNYEIIYMRSRFNG